MGRLFDAVAALCGIRLEVTYEGQAAIELEGAAGARRPRPLRAAARTGLRARSTRGRCSLAVVADLRAGAAPGVVAARFHDTVAAATAEACVAAASARGLGDGGPLGRRVRQPAPARGARRRALRAAGLRVLVPERLPPGDGGISYGQASVAAAQSAHSPTIGKWENRAR